MRPKPNRYPDQTPEKQTYAVYSKKDSLSCIHKQTCKEHDWPSRVSIAESQSAERDKEWKEQQCADKSHFLQHHRWEEALFNRRRQRQSHEVGYRRWKQARRIYPKAMPNQRTIQKIVPLSADGIAARYVERLLDRTPTSFQDERPKLLAKAWRCRSCQDHRDNCHTPVEKSFAGTKRKVPPLEQHCNVAQDQSSSYCNNRGSRLSCKDDYRQSSYHCDFWNLPMAPAHEDIGYQPCSQGC